MLFKRSPIKSRRLRNTSISLSPIEEMEDYIFEVLMPTETITEVKKRQEEDQRQASSILATFSSKCASMMMTAKFCKSHWYFVREAQGRY